MAVAGWELLSNCLVSSVTMITGGRAFTMAATGEGAGMLDQAQYDAGVGPCLSAACGEQVVRVDDLAAGTRWPRFRAAGREVGVGSSLSIPLLIDDDDVFGALNGAIPLAGSDMASTSCLRWRCLQQPG